MAMMVMSNKIKDDDGRGVQQGEVKSMMPISGGGVQEQPAKILVQVCQALVL